MATKKPKKEKKAKETKEKKEVPTEEAAVDATEVVAAAMADGFAGRTSPTKLADAYRRIWACLLYTSPSPRD